MPAKNRLASLCALVLSLTIAMPPSFAAAALSAPPKLVSGEEAIRRLGANLPAVAATHGFGANELKRTLRREKHLKVDARGKLLYQDAAASPADLVAASTYPTLNLSGISTAEVFALNSRPGSTRTLYLDFDGHVLTGTAWNASYGVGTINAPAFDIDGVPSNFSAEELGRIREMWARVAEDYAPFDVNVTTQYPGEAAITRSDSADLVFGNRVLISAISQYFGRWGGVSYVNMFSRVGDYYKPSLVFPENLGNHPKYVAEAASHEAGHSLGLTHDGTAGVEYYSGHGTGTTGWAPIMGNSYSRPVSQWSRGEYPGATNLQDDVAIISGSGTPLVADDYSDTDAGAPTFTGGPAVLGRISRPGDIDVLRVDAGAGVLAASVSLATVGSNLDASLEIVDATGRVVASANPVDSLGASVAPVVAAGTYYVHVRGIGKGDLTTGYSAYGSLGVYSLSVSAALPPVVVVPVNSVPAAVMSVSATSGTAPLPVSFDGSASTDSDGQIVSWQWAFGDGTTASGAAVTHTYGAAGTYSATLKVTDDKGATSSTARTIVVGAPKSTNVARVESISLTLIRGVSSRVSGSVRVVDQNGAPVSGAFVDARFSGKVKSGVSGYTDANGTVIFTSRTFKGTGTVTLTVRSVSKASWTFDASAGPTTGSIAASSVYSVRRSLLR